MAVVFNNDTYTTRSTVMIMFNIDHYNVYARLMVPEANQPSLSSIILNLSSDPKMVIPIESGTGSR